MSPKSRVQLRYHRPNTRRTDLLIALGCALLVHAGIFYGADWFGSSKTGTGKKAKQEEIILLEMPPLDPEKPEEVTPLEELQEVSALAPPTLPDVPTVVPLDAFMVPIEPPRPTGMEVGKNLQSIPIGRPGSPLGKGLGDLFNISNLDQAPVVRVKNLPAFPPEMKRVYDYGEVILEFIVDNRGNVIAVRVVHSSNVAFETAAVQAVCRWTFKPGRKNGHDVNTLVQQVITFNQEKY